MKFKFFKARSYDALEAQLNNFVTSKIKVKDIKFNVARNFLPHTNTCEVEEIFYILISYEEKNK